MFIGAAAATGLIYSKAKAAMARTQAMRLIEEAEKALQLHESEYASALKLACDNFRRSSASVSAHLRRIHVLLETRREELAYSKRLVMGGACSKDRVVAVVATTWNEEVSLRVRDIKQYFASV